jgi:hypothetical protein
VTALPTPNRLDTAGIASKPKPATSAAAKSKNWLLVKVRAWHGWLGVALSAFIILVCCTGIFLNHKDLLLGKEEKREQPTPDAAKGKPGAGGKHEAEGKEASGALRAGMSLSSLVVTPDRALALAQEKLGNDTALERLELKDDHGRLVYKLKSGDGREVSIDAATSVVTTKSGYKQQQDKPADKAGAMTSTMGYDWGKIIKDLHTGKVGGDAGKLFVDFTSSIIILLTLSGLYLWSVPKIRKAKAQREAAAKAVASKPV